MKRKLATIAVCVIASSASEVNAQWSLTGNSGTTPATNFIGTIDNKDLRIRTNNAVRVYIKSNGRVGIGQSAPAAKLDVKGGSGGSDTIPVINALVNFSGSVDVVGVNSVSNPAAGFGIGVSGEGGFIGVSGVGSSAGVFGFGAIGVDGEAAGADTTGATGLLIGTLGYVNTAADAIGVYGEADNGNFNTGVYGVTNNGGFTDTAGTKNWAGFFEGDLLGFRLFQISDAKFKQNIQPISSATNKLMQLTPSTYTFKKNTGLPLPSTKEYGLIAENVKQVFPELTKEARTVSRLDRNKNKIRQEQSFTSVNYVGLIPVLVASFQEQQQIMNKKDQHIAELEGKIILLAERLEALEGKSEIKTQNRLDNLSGNLVFFPNPSTGKTTLRYHFSHQEVSGKILITDVSGRSVMEIKVLKSYDDIEINTSQWAKGTYTATLYVRDLVKGSTKVEVK